MLASQKNITPQTPMGANLIDGGVTFKIWAPAALEIFINYDNHWNKGADSKTLLAKDPRGFWTGFVPGLKDGTEYKYWVVGTGTTDYKRDPYARELSAQPPFPESNCVVRDPASYPWHDQGFRPPPFNDLIIYQFHIGTFYGVNAASQDNRPTRRAKFLDVLFRLEYLVALGVNALQPLPVSEYPTEFSLGYNGVDLFSPEMDYSVPAAELQPYLAKANELLQKRGRPILKLENLTRHTDQLKALVDLCHVYGLAVIFDVVYNHAGGGFGDQGIYFLDRRSGTNDPNNSLFFTNQGWAGGLSFALWNEGVRQFLIDNATFYLQEYRVDGFRYDEVSTIISLNTNNGWGFCQDLSDTVRFVRPEAVQIAEYWPVNNYVVNSRGEGGAGFDASLHDGLRNSLRSAVSQAASGQNTRVDLDAVAANLYPAGFPQAWRGVHCLENHDIVYKDHAGSARIAALADSSNSRSWYGRSRSRVANGLLLTAPGIPMLFMGQEFLEDKTWSDDAKDNPGNLIWWDGLAQGQKPMVDHLRFTQELIALRRRQPALRAQALNVFHVHNDNRVIAFHRWVEGEGRDVVVVANLSEFNQYNYQLGFPRGGRWLELFNSDIYDNWVNPSAAGNGGSIQANGPGMHGMGQSASLTLPANSILVFALDA
jgi:1,4-alpha-glucan branching enzyme